MRLITVVVIAFLVSLAISLVGFAIAAHSETGPSASDVKAAMVRNGIAAGATFELGGHTYTLHDIHVSKVGPENFVVSFITK